MKKVVVIYHRGCPDGFGAAWAAWKKFGNKAEYIGEEHGKPADKDLKGKDVYMVDFSYKKPIIDEILKVAKSLTIIDHHVSAKSVVKSLKNHLYAVNHSGATLSWQYFHPGKKTPKLLLYVEDVDLWNFKLKETRNVICSLELYDFDFKIWSKLAKDIENPKTAKKYIEEGKAILSYKKVLIKQLVEKGDEAVIAGKKALAINSPVLRSELGNAIVKAGYSLGIVYAARGGVRRVSLRSKKGGVDVAKIAEKFGGGGHRSAAGFAMPTKDPFPWKITK